jgi:hypothetical protein
VKKIAQTFCLVLGVFLTSTEVFGQQICRNVYESACTPGIISDGTGVVATRPPEQRSANDPLTPETLSSLRNYFSSNRQVLRRQAVQQFDLQCEANLSTVSEDSDICDAEIEAKLVNLVQRRRASGTAGRYVLPELVFMEESGFLGLMNQVDFNGQLQVDVAEQEQKVSRLFKQVKTALVNKIRSSNLSAEDQRIIIDRLNRVENRGSDCGATFGVNDDYLPKAYYTPVGNEFYLCRNLLSRANSEFALITVIAHEISHSIDPCMLRLSNMQTYGSPYVPNFHEAEARFPYANLTSCLRSRNSINAINRAVSVAPANSGPIAVDYCDHSDQIGESTSDWFASEVLVEVMEQNYPNLTQEQWRNGIRNTYRAKCDQGHVGHNHDFDPHPPVEKRFNAIVLANSAVREKMGCSGVQHNKVQCSLNEPRGVSSSTGPTRRGSGSGSGGSGSGSGTTRPANVGTSR